MINSKALFNLGYGLYVVTCSDSTKDNALIVNTVMQLTSTPCRVAVTVSKQNYSHDLIKTNGILNVNCLTVETPFKVFEAFGFCSGKDKNKFEGCAPARSENGLVVLPHYINSFMSLKVENTIDLDSHTMFICSITQSDIVSDIESMTYAYYHKNVKPKPQANDQKGYICKICGYVHKSDTLPEDFICPICKHGASDFEKIV